MDTELLPKNVLPTKGCVTTVVKTAERATTAAVAQLPAFGESRRRAIAGEPGRSRTG
jgi:hypothetical protein